MPSATHPRGDRAAGPESGLIFALDYPSESAALYSNVNFVSGYCIGRGGPVERIALSLNGRPQSEAVLGYPRLDVSRRYPHHGDRALLSGFNGYFDSARLATGPNRFDFHIRAAAGETIIARTFTLRQPDALRIADVFIDIVGPCNLRCAMCPQGILERLGAERGPGYMPVDLFERVVLHLRAQGYVGKDVNLYNWGDPLLHPKLGEILDVCHASGLDAVVSTNLSFSTARVRALRRHPIDLMLVSVSGFSPATYAKNHVGGRFDLVRQNLEALRADRGGIKRVLLKYLLFRYNGHEVERAQAFCDDAGFEFGLYTGAIPSAESFFRYGADAEYRKQVDTYLAPDTITPQPARFCPQQATVTINHRAELERCCVSWGSGERPSLFETDLHRHLQRKLANDFCQRCLASGYSYYKHFGIVRPEIVKGFDRPTSDPPS